MNLINRNKPGDLKTRLGNIRSLKLLIFSSSLENGFLLTCLKMSLLSIVEDTGFLSDNYSCYIKGQAGLYRRISLNIGISYQLDLQE